jgi:nitrite reductase/ring-hydroxylating ferredoxin subunit
MMLQCSRKSDFKATGLRVADLPPGTMKEVSMALKGDAKGTILLAHTTTGAITATSSKCP